MVRVLVAILCVSIVCLFCLVAFGGNKQELKINFTFEGRVYVIDKIIAHPEGGMNREFVPDENGKFIELTPQPEMGRRVHRQVK